LSETKVVQIDVTVAAPVDVVWEALRDPSEIRRWFGWEYDGLTEEIDAIFLENASASDDDHTVELWGGDRFSLEARGDETVVQVTRAAPADPSWDGIYEGWVTFVQQLRFALGRHRGEDRRTLYLSGTPKAPGDPLPPEIVHDRTFALAPGERYEATVPTGETVSGELWYRSAHQIGLTVDDYGDGLVVLTGKPAPLEPPHGAGTVLITTYGLDDDTLEALHRRWTEWWEAR
jgi:uncharacterized protein YndB with AHSA1/START domain